MHDASYLQNKWQKIKIELDVHIFEFLYIMHNNKYLYKLADMDNVCTFRYVYVVFLVRIDFSF